jgi:Putative peptidoglycan binding domain
MNSHSFSYKKTVIAALTFTSTIFASASFAAVHTDSHGNVGYDTAVECDAAVTAGTAKFYQSTTSHPALNRAGEATVKTMLLKDLVQAQDAAKALGYEAASYAKGACDVGVGRSQGRDGVSTPLIGKYVPYSSDMPINAYFDAQGKLVRAMMQQCDNNFGKNLPRPVGNKGVTLAASECYATVLTPAKFETKTEQVVKFPATQRAEVIPATMKSVSEQVLVAPELRRQFPVAATYKTITEEVVVRPATTRDEPINATYKMVPVQVEVQAASKRIEIIPATYKTATEKVLASAERREIRVTPAVYGEAEEIVIVTPASTRVETTPPTYKTVSEQVIAKPESIRYEPIQLPLRKVTEQAMLTEGSKRIEASQATYKTVTERVVSKEAGKRLVEVPAVYETVTERIKISDATREWKRGRAYIGQAIDVRPLRGFVIGTDGKVGGDRVEFLSAAGGTSKGTVDQQVVMGNNNNLDDDVMCLVAVPEQYQTVTRQIVKTPATVREIEIPAEYTTITHQVIDRAANSREIDIPATYQTVTRTEIDTDKLRTLGYKFDDKGDISTMPNGDRVVRAASIAGMTASRVTAGGVANVKTAGAQSGEEGYVREVKTPAVIRLVERQIIDQPASVRTIEVAAVTKTIKRKIVITPAATTEELVPAVYKEVTRQVVDTPASSREIVIPAVFKTLERKVLDTPAATKQIAIPAVTEMVKRRVIDVPASVREEVVPAVYKTVTRQVVDTAATTRLIAVPAQYETLSQQVKVADASTQRRAILCETNATPAKIMEIQAALKAAGFNPGPVNGQLRAATMTAVNQYQKANNLPVDGFLNLETVKALGVSAN